MKNTLEDPRTPETPADPDAEKAFLDLNSHIPDVIETETKDEFKDAQPAAQPVAAQPGWTADDVAHIFAGFFMILSFPLTRPITGFGGDHWSIPDEKCKSLGRAWLPIFQKHIPYDRKPGMIADLFMWLPAMGALKSVCDEPIKMEIALFRQRKLIAMKAAEQRAAAAAGKLPPPMTAPSTMASTATATH